MGTSSKVARAASLAPASRDRVGIRVVAALTPTTDRLARLRARLDEGYCQGSYRQGCEHCQRMQTDVDWLLTALTTAEALCQAVEVYAPSCHSGCLTLAGGCTCRGCETGDECQAECSCGVRAINDAARALRAALGKRS